MDPVYYILFNNIKIWAVYKLIINNNNAYITTHNNGYLRWGANMSV